MEQLLVNILLQAHLYFVIYSIGIDFTCLVVKIKIFNLVVWGLSAPKGHPQPHRLTQINVLYSVL
jgi:hypothetical protein